MANNSIVGSLGQPFTGGLSSSDAINMVSLDFTKVKLPSSLIVHKKSVEEPGISIDLINMHERLKTICELLGVIDRTPQLEEKYPHLKDIARRYDNTVLEMLDIAKLRSIKNEYVDYENKCKLLEEIKNE